MFFSREWESRRLYNKIDTRQRKVVLLVLFWGFSQLWSHLMGPVEPSFQDSISFTRDDFDLLLLKWFRINLKFPSSQNFHNGGFFSYLAFPNTFFQSQEPVNTLCPIPKETVEVVKVWKCILDSLGRSSMTKQILVRQRKKRVRE